MNVGSINRGIRAAPFPEEVETSADRSRTLRMLWDVFTSHMHRE